jgi:hypothetical protein
MKGRDGFAELGFAELGFAELGFAELGFAHAASANARPHISSASAAVGNRGLLGGVGLVSDVMGSPS